MSLSYETLRGELGSAFLVGSGEKVPAADARQLACQADIIPAVLGGNSELLDLGRAQRYFSGPARTGLVLRDRGCAFPGCDAPPAACEGHHVDPWEAGGGTDRSNGVLVCAYHHRMIEPDPNVHPDHQWAISFDQRGDPVFTPPLQVDLQRRPRQHHRYRRRE